MGFDTPWQMDVDAWRMRDIGQASLDLLDGRIEGANHDCTLMPGTTPLRSD